ncbi:threonine aldolase [Chelatococcus reniformis]|uniref:Threonine aldolase n=2 Tax=Chelatococcus reniformis TaxID=1494448 RepID=A0A916UTG2_9HYPH|nr:threonine aldolase [Chelatococcus reniformis]
MAEAEVGDDVYGDDPTVKALEAATAELLGKDDAVYMPSGTMTNQVGIRTHTQPGDAALYDHQAHVYQLEGGASAAISGVLPRLLPGVRGIFSPADVESAFGRDHRFVPSAVAPPVRLLCLENTHNAGGGSVWPLDTLTAVAGAGRARGLALHLDGARLWHATVATGVAEAAYAAPFDSVSVCFSKALGAPVGSCLAGSHALVARARRFKQQFGGGFRQAGIIAAGALHALRHHRERLHETHANARRFAEGLAAMPGIALDLATVETNIVRFQLTHVAASAFVDEAHRRGVHMLPSGSDGVRAVFYLDIAPQDVDDALTVVDRTLAALARSPPEGA